MNKPITYIVTVRAKDAELVAAGSSYSRRCVKCSEIVATSPLSEARARDNPAVVFICSECYKLEEGRQIEITPGEAEQALKTIVPNMYKVRN